MDRLTTQGKALSVIRAATYTDRCTIKRKVSQKSGLDTTYTQQIVAVDVPVQIKPASAAERQIAGATQGSTAYSVRLPAWQGDSVIDLDSKCFLEIAARGEVEAQTLQVIAPLSSSGVKLEAVAVRQS